MPATDRKHLLSYVSSNEEKMLSAPRVKDISWRKAEEVKEIILGLGIGNKMQELWKQQSKRQDRDQHLKPWVRTPDKLGSNPGSDLHHLCLFTLASLFLYLDYAWFVRHCKI